jgi:hypothetical protein
MTDKAVPTTGGCLCGAIRYESSEPPIQAGTCHCRTCQKSTGSAFMTIAGFSRSAFRFTSGEPKLYRSSSIMDKGFCSNCGSLLFDQYLVRTPGFDPDIVFVQLGTLDHPEAVSLDFHYGVETQLPWVHFGDDLPRTRCDEDPQLVAAFTATSTAKK